MEDLIVNNLFDNLSCKLNCATENYPSDYLEFINSLVDQINGKQSWENIYNELFSYFETIFTQKGYFMPESSYYCGFVLEDLKKPIYECIITSLYLYITEKQLLSHCNKKGIDFLDLINCNTNSNFIKDSTIQTRNRYQTISKRIENLEKKSYSEKYKDYIDNFDKKYYKAYLKVLSKEAHPMIRSLELSHFIFGENIKTVSKNIAGRYHYKKFIKLSENISEYIEFPTNYYEEDIPFTPSKMLAYDFENTFHIILLNQIMSYFINFSKNTDEHSLKPAEFIIIASGLSDLQPYWIKESANEETIVDKFCKYVINLNFDEAAKRVFKTTQFIKRMVHEPLEYAFTVLFQHKHKSDEEIKKFIDCIMSGKEWRYMHESSKYSNQFDIKISDKCLKDSNIKASITNLIGRFPKDIDFEYNENNMFSGIGEASEFDVMNCFFDRLPMVKELKKELGSYNLPFGMYYNAYLYIFDYIFDNYVCNPSAIAQNNYWDFLYNFPFNISNSVLSIE